MKDQTKKNGGIPIGWIQGLMVASVLIVVALLVFSLYQSSNVFSTLSTETGNYLTRQKAAHNLMEASDYLTEMAQRFTLDGDTVYMDNYFEEAYTSKRREAAILAMSEGNADASLMGKLQEAMEESQSLMFREYYAMKLVTEAKNIQTVPDTLKGIELTEEDSLLSPEEKMEKAQKMVMDSEYYSSKEIIRTELKAGLDEMDRQMSATRQETNAKSMADLTRNRVLVAISGVLLLVMAWAAGHFANFPLMLAGRSIRKGEEAPSFGSREYRMLAEEYNEKREQQKNEE